MEKTFEDLADDLKVIGHPLRLRILTLLASANRTVAELATETNSEKYAVSVNLNILKSGGMVQRKRTGKVVTYSLTPTPIVNLITQIPLQ